VTLAIMSLFIVAVSAATVLTVRLSRAGLNLYVQAQNRLAESDLASLFIFVTAERVTALSCGLAAIVAVLALLLNLPWLLLCLCVAASLSAPRVWVRRLKHQRMQRIAAQLPDALGLWAGLLRSGQGMAHALTQVADNQPPPIGEELRMLVRQLRIGLPVEAGVEEFRARAGVADLAMIGTLLRATRELGGNLAESLQRLSDVMRARLAMEARIRSLTAQGRLQGLIVGALPVLLMAVLFVMEPQSMSVLYTKPLGWAALLLIAILEAAGFILIRRIVNIRV
jgi:tight adherence protein B